MLSGMPEPLSRTVNARHTMLVARGDIDFSDSGCRHGSVLDGIFHNRLQNKAGYDAGDTCGHVSLISSFSSNRAFSSSR